MPLRTDLLDPIAGSNPGGTDIRYESIYDQIREARREDEDIPQGDWQTTRKLADYQLVIKLGSEVLATRSKDLQVAAWLTEALIRREGFAGLKEALAFLRGLIEQYWESLYPELEDGDAEFRAAPLEWIGSRLDVAVKSVPLNRAGHSYLDYAESRSVGYEDDVSDDSSKRDARQRLIDQGKLAPEEFDREFSATPKAWYKELVANLDTCLTELDALDEVGQEKFGDVAPGYGGLRGSLEEVQRVARQLLARKLEADPDPLELEPASPVSEEADTPQGDSQGDSAPAATSGAIAAEPASQADAAARVVGAARYLRRADPANPTSYLLLRGLRWGELRAGGSPPDPKLLEAPTSQVRSQLKGYLLDAKWPQLLEAGECVMATGAGCGWLDLQRYAITACSEMGSEYAGVARAVTGELHALLTDVPQLLDMTLMDDMPTASPETRTWLQERVLGGRISSASSNGDAEGNLAFAGNGKARDNAFERAQAEVRAGRVSRAIELLSAELARETSRRGRFLRQVQLAGIMVESELEAVAAPILEEMMEVIETHKLEEWEAGSLVAEPLALLHRCLAKTDGDASDMRRLYLRLCRLDPVQAIRVSER